MVRVSTFSLLFRSGLRSLKKGWTQFLSIIMIGAIAMTLFVGLLANAESFEHRVNSVYREGNLASLWVTVSKTSEEDETNIKTFLSSNDIFDKRLYMPIQLGNRDSYLAVYASSPKVSKPYGDTSSLNLSSNRYFLLDEAMKKSESSSLSSTYSIGDEIQISFDISNYHLSDYSALLAPYLKEDSKKILTDKEITLTTKVTGFMKYPENITKSTYNSSVALMGKETLKDLLVDFFNQHILEGKKQEIIALLAPLVSLKTMDVGNQYLISLGGDSESALLKKKIEDYYASNGGDKLKMVTTRGEMPFFVTVNNDVTQARQFTFVFPFVFFFVALLVILTTLSEHILQERTQIGALKAIGVSKGQIYLLYSSLTLFLVGLGVIIGEIVGPLLIPQILGNKYAIFYSLPPLTYTFPVLYGVFSALVFLAISVVTTILVCHKEVSLKPVDSLRPKKPNSLKFISRGNKASVYSLSIKMALRNIRLNIGKSIMVIAGVMGCTALLLCGFGIEDTVYYGIDNDLSTLKNSDISVTFNQTMSKSDVIDDLAPISGISAVEPTSAFNSLIYKEDGPQANSHLYVVSENSRCYKITFGKEEVAVSKKVARLTKCQVGDKMFFSYGGQVYSAKIGMIYEAFAYHGIMVHEDISLFKDVSFSYSGAQIYLKDGVAPSEVNQEILKKNYVLSSQTTEEWNLYIKDVMSGVITMTNAVKVFALLLALVVLYNLSLMNFRERSRDIATLKVLGFKRNEIALSLLFETMSLTLIGASVGVLLGYPFLYLVMGTNVVELVEYLYFIKPVSFVFAFGLSFITAFLVNFVFSMKTKKIKMVESLKSVE